MHKKQASIQSLLAQKLLPLYYHEDAGVSKDILHALYDAGIRILEYTNRGGAALENFRVLRAEATAHMPGLQLGIGTIKNSEQAGAYIGAGADFIVCPSVNIEVGEVVDRAGLLWVPGCMTPTEIATAENAGATIVKIFPGNILGPSYITSIKDLFPQLQFVVTGGVEAEAANLENWFRAGVVGVGMGSKLLTKKRIDEKDYKGLTEATVRALKLVEQVYAGVDK